MQFIKSDINLDFIGKRKIAFCLSIVLILVCISSLVIHKGPKYGIDFAGGSLVQVKFLSPVTIDGIKTGLKAIGLGDSSVQRFGNPGDNEYLIRTDASVASSEGFSETVSEALGSTAGADLEIRRIEMVGPQVGKDLREKALFAMFYALLFITIYISGRFELKWLLSGVMAGALIGAVYFLSLFDVSIPILMAAALIVTLILFWFLLL